MSVAVYPVFQTDVPEIEPHMMVGGKGIGGNVEALEALAQSLEVSSLMQFFSITADEVAESMELEEGELPDFEVVEEWFDPATAILTVDALRDYVHSHPETVENADWVIEDLDAVTAALTVAQENGVRFHFAMDI